VFRVIEFQPGVASRLHRTDSIDYAVVMAGEIDMALDDSEVHLKAGDVLSAAPSTIGSIAAISPASSPSC
jgi:uncharacterized cupin superfamily protein